MKHRYSKFNKPFLLIGDILALNLSFFLGFYLAFNSFAGLFSSTVFNILLIFNLTWTVIILISNPYTILRVYRISHVLKDLFFVIGLHILAISSVLAFAPVDFSRKQLIFTYILFTVILFTQRVVYVYLIRIYRKIGFNYRNAVIVGHGEISKELDGILKIHPEYGYNLLGYFDDKDEGPEILGKLNDLKQYVILNNVDVVYCCLPEVDYRSIADIIEFCEDNFIKIQLIADFRGFSYKGLALEMYDYIPVLNVTPIPLDNWKNQLVKRTFDVFFSLIVIIAVLSWLIPLLAIIISLDSKGPVFFVQKRSGKINNTFQLLKFRTMKRTKGGPAKVTRVGHFLRKFRIDEVPQFFNVLLGDMSVVGPRPHMIEHTEEYSQVIERFMARHFVKPGITGLAQAKGYRGETRGEKKHIDLMKNRVRFDKFYVENWTLLLDIKILFLTMVSLAREGDKTY